MRKSKTASISEISRHWNVKDHDTVRRILTEAKLQPVSLGPARYRWADIWALEGADWVAPSDEAAFQVPLRTPQELQAFFGSVPVRTITDQARKKRIPAVRIGKHWRFREVTLERWLDHG